MRRLKADQAHSPGSTNDDLFGLDLDEAEAKCQVARCDNSERRGIQMSIEGRNMQDGFMRKVRFTIMM